MNTKLASSIALVLVACGGGSSNAPAPSAATATAATPASTAKADGSSKTAEDPAKQAAAIDALTEDETKKGACDPDHKAALEKLLADVDATMKAKNGDDGKPLGMQTVDKRVVALGPQPRSITMTVTGRGTEVHVIAIGLRSVSMDVMAAGVAATTMRSPFQRSAASTMKLELPKIGTVNELEGDSRQIQIKPGQPLEVKLRGQGCAIVGAFQKP